MTTTCSLHRLSHTLWRYTKSTPINQRFPKLFTSSSSDGNHANAARDSSGNEKKPDHQEEKGAHKNQNNKKEEEELTVLYDNVLKQVSTHGWTDRAIAAAVTDLGWSPAAAQMIPRGPIQAVEQFVKRSNIQLAKRLSQEDEKDAAAAGGTDPVGRATFAIRERLEMIEPYHHNWASALALQILPQNSRKALKSSALLMDEIAHYAGYRDANFSWYTDRAVLGMIYGATELYWLTDKTHGRQETWRFLEKRMRDSHEMRNGISSAYVNFMTFSDAAKGTLRTIRRSARSY
ncbi:unnamed protein product [Agarophyton chilense]